MSSHGRRLEIRAPVIDALVAHAEREAPRECCGLLAGKRGRILVHAPLPNVSEAPEREYFGEPRALVTALREFRQRGLELLGIYHSHPSSPPRPSPTDIDRAYYPDCVYIIIGPPGATPRVRGFHLERGAPSRQSFEIALEVLR